MWGRADAALPAERLGTGARSHAALLHRPGVRFAERAPHVLGRDRPRADIVEPAVVGLAHDGIDRMHAVHAGLPQHPRSEEHTSELQSLMRISYAVFCLNKK